MTKNKEDNFVNFMMGVVAAPVVVAWVGLAVFLVIQAFNDKEVVTDIESYKQGDRIFWCGWGGDGDEASEQEGLLSGRPDI